MISRYLHMLKLCMIRSPMKRAAYMRENRIFHSIGEHVMITSRKIPLYARLISIGNNVWIASGVEFITHDVTHYMLNEMNIGYKYTEKIGCIEIGDNVFIGAGVKILYDVRIGNNVIIAAGALVNKDIASNSVVGGVPARVITLFDNYLCKRKTFAVKNVADNTEQKISPECEKEMWVRFEMEHRC